jgi:Leucine-rich repeat (LRR) protein
MEWNLLTGVIPTYFGKFQNMQGLYLGKQIIRENPKLHWQPHSIGCTLFVQNNLEGSIPPSIGNCRSLQKLDVSQNYLGGVIPQQVFDLSSLSIILNLSYNSFSGKLPIEVGNLKNLYSLDVSECHLSGEIPMTIGSCSNLDHLYLQGNFFKGIIPSSLASIKGLEHLDLSRNNLSGLIPKGLERLSFLIYLNLSFNDIEGELPTEGVFKNVNAISVVGNNKICGGIPQLQLSRCLKVTKSRKFNCF